MIKKKGLTVDEKVWTPAHARLLKRAASYPEVERILVHPGIKKKLCDTVTGDRSWLRKVRPFWGHDYHFHIRIGCQPGSTGCKAQAATGAGDGCDKSLAWWFTEEPWRPNKNPDAPKARDLMTLSSLPKACRAVLDAPAPQSEAAVTYRGKAPPAAVASSPQPAMEAAPVGLQANAYLPSGDVVIPLPEATPGIVDARCPPRRGQPRRFRPDGPDALFSVDPLTPMPHDVDVKALMRLAIVYDIPMALNRATAKIMLARNDDRRSRRRAGTTGMQTGRRATALEFPILLGDVGGTNARFAVVRDADSGMGAPQIVQTADFPTIDDAIRAAVLERLGVRPRSAVIAVAGPVDGDAIALTNCPWVVRPKGMFDTLGIADIVVLNDFEAQALAVVALGEEHTRKDRRRHARSPTPRAWCSAREPGSASPASCIRAASGSRCPAKAATWTSARAAAATSRSFRISSRIEGRISGEQILCGRGLVNAYRAVAAADGKTPRLTTPAEITRAALDGSDEIAVEALAFFVTCLGRTAGDVALVFKSRGGVFLTGGIAQKIVPALKAGNFRAAFEDKAPHSAMMNDHSRLCHHRSARRRSPGSPPMRVRPNVSEWRPRAAAGGAESSTRLNAIRIMRIRRPRGEVG